MLYPLKFRPIFKERIWGGFRLGSLFGKEYPKADVAYGESWELSSVEGSQSVVSNGPLEGNSINFLAEKYKNDLLGEAVFNRYGANFPLLIKLIDAAEPLSVQVHPGNEMAYARHNASGKTEMWYVLHADQGAEIVSGLKPGTNRAELARALQTKQVANLLNSYPVAPNDYFYIPSGTVHAIGGGVVLLEIQQASDITYRLYDWDRVDAHGNPRELHINYALESISYGPDGRGKMSMAPTFDRIQKLVECNHFVVSRMQLTAPMEFDRYTAESFAVYFCIRGSFNVNYSGGHVEVKKGELILLPAIIERFDILPETASEIIEISIYG